MSELFWVALKSKDKKAEKSHSASIDRQLRASESRNGDGHWTCRVPDYAMPEKLTYQAENGRNDWPQKYPVTKRRGEFATVDTELHGPWNQDMINSFSEFRCRLDGDRVSAITDVRPRVLEKKHIDALYQAQTILEKSKKKGGKKENKELFPIRWKEGKSPDYRLYTSRHLDTIYDCVEQNMDLRKNLSVYKTVMMLLNACRYEKAKNLFFGSNAIYHWSNIGFMAPHMTMECADFLTAVIGSHLALLAFGRTARALAGQTKTNFGMFSFPLIRFDIYKKSLNSTVMAQYFEEDRAIWELAYKLFYEFFIRIYSDNSSLLPWTKSPMLGIDVMRNGETVLSGASCVLMQDLEAKNIPGWRKAVTLLEQMGCIEIKEGNTDVVIYFPSTLEAEESFAKGVAELHTRAFQGIMPRVNIGATELYRTLCQQSNLEEEKSLNRDQINVLTSVAVHPFTILTGAAGCGKTAVVSKIPLLFKPYGLMACAPTCNAVARIAGGFEVEESGRTCQYHCTVAKFWNVKNDFDEKQKCRIYVRPTKEDCDFSTCKEMVEDAYSDDNWKKEYKLHFPIGGHNVLLTGKQEAKENRIIDAMDSSHPMKDTEIIALDEAGMCSTNNITFFPNALEYSPVSRFIAILDPDQLGATGAGQPFRTILERKPPGFNIINLTKNYRVLNDNKSVVVNCNNLSKGRMNGYQIDQYSRILYRMQPSLIWIACQIFAASNYDMDSLQVITNRVSDATIMNKAFYVLYVWKSAGRKIGANFIDETRGIQKLLAYLVFGKANPWFVGASQVVENSAISTPPKSADEEVEMLKKLHVHIGIGMRVAYSRNNRSTKISANKQMIVRGFIDVSVNYLLKAMVGDYSFKWYEEDISHAASLPKDSRALQHATDKPHPSYDASCFKDEDLHKEYCAHAARPFKVQSPLVRCMLYTLYTPYDKSLEEALHWVPIEPSSLSLVESNILPCYARTVNGVQGGEFENVFYLYNFPDKIISTNLTDAFIDRSHPYTALSRAQKTMTLVVAAEYAMKSPRRMDPSKLCLLSDTMTADSISGSNFFGLKKSIMKKPPPPTSLLHEFIEKEMGNVSEFYPKLKECNCANDRSFARRLLEFGEKKSLAVEKRKEEERAALQALMEKMQDPCLQEGGCLEYNEKRERENDDLTSDRSGCIEDSNCNKRVKKE